MMTRRIKLFNQSILAALTVITLSCSTDKGNTENVEKGRFHAVISFEGSGAVTRAAGSTAIPVTSWDDIGNAQVFLIEGGAVKYSKTIEVPATGVYDDIWTDVPVGTYTVSVVANTDSDTDNIRTSIDGGTTYTRWDNFNVRQKNLSELTMYLKNGTFPGHATGYNAMGKTAKVSPSEIFMGSEEGIVVSTSGPDAEANLSLKREVAMMRIRVNQVMDSPAGDVDFQHTNASIMYHRVPKGMTILSGINGGVMTGSSDTGATVVAHSGGDTFITTDTDYGTAGTHVLDGDYTMWRDLVVLPNCANRNSSVLTTDREYTIVISGQAPAGHVLANNEVLSQEATVYWSGRISESFVPNKIREVNLEVRTGGSTTLPDIREEGTLVINIGKPLDWDAVIDETSIIL